MDNYDIVANAVKEYWKKNKHETVIAIFDQKYGYEKEWEHIRVLVDFDDRYEDVVIFNYDFLGGSGQHKRH